KRNDRQQKNEPDSISLTQPPVGLKRLPIRSKGAISSRPRLGRLEIAPLDRIGNLFNPTGG
ncbi:hypothetical protein, partial [Aeromonas caviae]|uniref:hypothetical protein n=1 Tax=Aeromonas caviae TaxID=648 RepID=UPI001CC4B387